MSTSAAIRQISHSEILGAPNAQELIDEYAAECSNPLLGSISPQVGAYAALEAAGLMAFYGVFDGETLVGFASVLISGVPHYEQALATVESLFVAKAHRVRGSGRALMDALEHHAFNAGQDVILYTAPAYSQLAKLLAASHDYVCTNIVFGRRLR